MLGTALLVALTAGIIQLAIKPLIVTRLLPQGSPYQNNVTRGTVYGVAYVLVLFDTAAKHNAWPILAAAWGLIVPAILVGSAAIAGYHIVTDAPTPPLADDGHLPKPTGDTISIPGYPNPVTVTYPAPGSIPLNMPPISSTIITNTGAPPATQDTTP